MESSRHEPSPPPTVRYKQFTALWQLASREAHRAQPRLMQRTAATEVRGSYAQHCPQRAQPLPKVLRNTQRVNKARADLCCPRHGGGSVGCGCMEVGVLGVAAEEQQEAAGAVTVPDLGLGGQSRSTCDMFAKCTNVGSFALILCYGFTDAD